MSALRYLAVLIMATICAFAVQATLAAAYTPSHAPRSIYFKAGPETNGFLNYDGGPNYNRKDRDWPVTLVFYGNARVNKAKDALEEISFPRSDGGTKFLPWRLRYNTRYPERIDRDKGKKTQCNHEGRDMHARVYASNADQLYDPEYGYYVVASTHYDTGDTDDGPGDPCYTGKKKRFGFSETVEGRIAKRFTDEGYRVHRNVRQAYNYEKKRTISPQSEDHIWESNGKLTSIRLKD